MASRYRTLLYTSAYMGMALATQASHSRTSQTVERKSVSFLQMQAPGLGAMGTQCDPVPFIAPEETRCPRRTWLDAMVEADPRPGKVFMDIGCNKGDDAIEMMERWDATGHFWSKQKWMDLYAEVLGSEPKYACGRPSYNFRRVAPTTDAVHGSVSVCVEPMEANFRMLRNISSTLAYTPHGRHGPFHTIQAALSDHAVPGETIQFPNGNPGDEAWQVPHVASGAAASHPRVAQTPVPLSTVDRVKADLQLAKVDILRIDTEGADPAVLLGARSTLETVRYLEFEVHRDLHNTAWEKTTLKSVVASLFHQGFDCYWAGNNGLLISLNYCWKDRFERGAWANAVCVKRNDVWASTLRAFSRP
mmetsp:Transcript_5420/g.5932  ORF Transcript_5420/g.5932 Transcript_5420/m.5932 type:complete len:361 (-) Transcript_5420:129-1211(-)